MKEEKIIINNYELSKEQLKPILDNENITLVSAGAGSGKTLMLLGKIKYMLSNNLLKSKDICCLSFTRETVLNLDKQIKKNCHVNVNCYTFHKLAMKILENNNYEYELAPKDFKETIINDFFNNDYLKSPIILKCMYKYFHLKIFAKKRLKYQNLTNLKKIIEQFLNLMSSNGYTNNDFKNFFKKDHSPLLFIIYAVYLKWEKEKENLSYIDFDDLIIKATQTIIKEKRILPFKLIIIDEWQDTSLIRLNLIKAIIKYSKSQLLVVGDDWQSIYNFSGCNINLFLNFSDYFPESKYYKLEKTYRNSQELIDLASRFILKNKYQLTKKMISDKKRDKPIKIVYFNNYKTVLNKVINMIGEDKNIFILGRNNYDIKKYNYTNFNSNIRYLTIHSSKGLEADYIIVINVINDIHGLPSKVKDNNIFKLVKTEEKYLYEEERRLFYVALTRSLNDVYLLTTPQNQSIFIKEIKNNKEVKIIHL